MIRRATVEDRERVVEMAQEFVSGSEYRDVLSINPDRLLDTMDRLLNNEDAAIFVSGSDASLTGMLALVAYAHPFSGELIGSELVWWVDQEARGHGVRLLRAAEDWARDRGCVKMQMVAPNGRIGTLYSRLGYTLLEASFQRSLS